MTNNAKFTKYKITSSNGKFYLWKTNAQGKTLVTLDTRKDVVVQYAYALIKGSN